MNKKILINLTLSSCKKQFIQNNVYGSSELRDLQLHLQLNFDSNQRHRYLNPLYASWIFG